MNYQATMDSIRANPERWQKAQDAMTEVLSRSASDAGFRQQLLTNPRAALSSHFGKELPESFQIRFVDAQGVPTVVLPEVATGELAEADLEAVSGGIAPLVAAAWFAGGFVCAAIGDALF
jgi:hypothetical protein